MRPVPGVKAHPMLFAPQDPTLPSTWGPDWVLMRPVPGEACFLHPRTLPSTWGPDWVLMRPVPGVKAHPMLFAPQDPTLPSTWGPDWVLMRPVPVEAHPMLFAPQDPTLYLGS